MRVLRAAERLGPANPMPSPRGAGSLEDSDVTRQSDPL
jgi:hypothetical protein